jgi:hypothetical protein
MTKNKLRSIIIDEKKYLWNIKTRYILMDESIVEYETEVDFKAYVNGYKNNPLIINFRIWEDPVSGNPLTGGIGEVNMNKPSIAKLLILEGLAKGWVGQEKKLVIYDGKQILRNAGIDISKI